MDDRQFGDDKRSDDRVLIGVEYDDAAAADAQLNTEFVRYFVSLPEAPDSGDAPELTPQDLEEQTRTTAGADELAALAARLEPGDRTAQILAVMPPSKLSAAGKLDAACAAERLASWIHATQLRHLAAFACPGVAASADNLSAYASAPGQPLHSATPAGRTANQAEVDQDLTFSGSQVHGDRQRNLALIATAHKVAAAELSAALLISPLNASRRVAQATTYVDELPATLKALGDGFIDRGRAMVIADRTQNLPTDLRHRVEQVVVAKAVTRTAGQIRAIADRAVIAVDPEAAKKRHEIAKRNRGVSLRPDEDGMSQVRADLTADKACTAFNLIDQIATFNSRDSDEHRSIGALRADAFADIFDQLADHGIVDLHHLLSSRDNTNADDAGTENAAFIELPSPTIGAPSSDAVDLQDDKSNENRSSINDSADLRARTDEPDEAAPGTSASTKGAADVATTCNDADTRDATTNNATAATDVATTSSATTTTTGTGTATTSDAGTGNATTNATGTDTATTTGTGTGTTSDTGIRNAITNATGSGTQPATTAPKVSRNSGLDSAGADVSVAADAEVSKAVDQDGPTVDLAPPDDLTTEHPSDLPAESDRSGIGAQPAGPGDCTCDRREPPVYEPPRGLGTHQGRPINLNITMAATTLAGLDDLPAELDGHGAIHPDIARALLDSTASVTAVAVNPTCGTALDLGRTVYRPRLAQRDYVTKRDQTCRFPSCRQPAWRCQIDHSNEFCPGTKDSGVTCPCNLTCLCKFHHDLKTFRLWDTDHHPDGSISWISPIGRIYTTKPRTWLTGVSTEPSAGSTESAEEATSGTGMVDRSDPTANEPDNDEPPF